MTHLPLLLRLLYDSRNFNWRLLMAPRRLSLMKATLSNGAMPLSIKAIATSTGARPSPATQCVAMHEASFTSSLGLLRRENLESTRSSQLETTVGVGGSPSSNGQSYGVKLRVN